MSAEDGGGLGRATVLTRRASRERRLQAKIAELEKRISVMNWEQENVRLERERQSYKMGR